MTKFAVQLADVGEVDEEHGLGIVDHAVLLEIQDRADERVGGGAWVRIDGLTWPAEDISQIGRGRQGRRGEVMGGRGVGFGGGFGGGLGDCGLGGRKRHHDGGLIMNVGR